MAQPSHLPGHRPIPAGRYRGLRRVVLPLILLLPVACAQPEPGDTADAIRQAISVHQANLAGVGGLTSAAPPIGRTAPQAALPAPVGPTPNLAGQLVGQTPETVLAWLGPPRLRRAEGPAEIWHYQSSQCHLDVVLYHEGASEPPALRVVFAAARSVGTVRRTEAACLRDIARGAARPSPPGAGASETVQTG
ncbi:hypothetical protein [Falsiroseomonas sp.]|uniref:hypothetical protein n=1 Tax=Falsiroseomonas sp. TaxID=2870721 RepID=UPI0034A2B9C8